MAPVTRSASAHPLFTTALTRPCQFEKSWQLGFEWGWCNFYILEDILMWCQRHDEQEFAQRCKDWFRRERTCEDERSRNTAQSNTFWFDPVLNPYHVRPIMRCTEFRLPSPQDLNLQALFSLSSTGAVPTILRSDEQKCWYIAKDFGGCPLPDLEDNKRYDPSLHAEAKEDMIGRLWRGLDAIHAAGWTLGDIRPEGIFVDVREEAITEEAWSDYYNDYELPFVSQNFDVYFVYFGRASNSKEGWEDRVATDCSALTQIIGKRDDYVPTDA